MLTPGVWDGWVPGDRLPAEIQAIVARAVENLLTVWVRSDGSLVYANEQRAA